MHYLLTRFTQLAMFSLLISLGAVVNTAAGATTLTFDDIGFSGSYGSFSGDVYESQGVLISSDGEESLTYALDGYWGFIAHSTPYGVAAGQSPQSVQYGVVRIDFIHPGTTAPTTASGISVWAGDASTETDTITIAAFNSAGILLTYDTFITGEQPGNGRSEGMLNLDISGVSYVTISATHPISFDDFSFTLELQAIPTLSSIALLVLILILTGIAIVLIRPKRQAV